MRGGRPGEGAAGAVVGTTTLAERIARTGDGRIRTLIIGGGIAGLTLACLLRQRGERPQIVERAPSLDYAGYNLGLYPLGSSVLHGLGLFEQLRKVAVPMRFYELGNGTGRILRHFDFASICDNYGPMLGLKRMQLLEVLRQGLGDLPIHFGETVSALTREGREVTAGFRDGSSATFDLVVGADGIHSTARSMILSADEVSWWDMGWSCWVTWADEKIVAPETAVEFWGAGFLVGIYPVRGAQGVVIAGPKKVLEHDGRRGFAEKVRHHLRDFGGPVPAVLNALEKDENPFLWDLQECRCARWIDRRVVLLGDAAAGFLPTAGVGASMAMLGAAVLADQLARADADHLDCALRLFYSRMRLKTDAAQDTSRRLARSMAVESAALAWGREQLVRFYTLDRALRDIAKVMEDSI